MPDIWGLASILAKCALYAGICGATGLVMIRLVYAGLVASIDRSLRASALALAFVALAAALLGFMLRGAALTGDSAGLTDPEMLGLLWTTPVGDALTYRLVGAALMIVGLMLPVIGLWLALAGGTLALWSFSQIGHVPEVDQTGIRLVLLGHLLGVSFWIGVLGPLRHLARDPENLTVAARLGHRFGMAAAVIVPVLVLAGAGMAWLILGSVSAVLTTGYGLALVGKVALVALLLGLAAANKLRLVPAMQAGDPQAARHLIRSINCEAIIIIAILAATATLTSVLTLPN